MLEKQIIKFKNEDDLNPCTEAIPIGVGDTFFFPRTSDIFTMKAVSVDMQEVKDENIISRKEIYGRSDYYYGIFNSPNFDDDDCFRLQYDTLSEDHRDVDVSYVVQELNKTEDKVMIANSKNYTNIRIYWSDVNQMAFEDGAGSEGNSFDGYLYFIDSDGNHIEEFPINQSVEWDGLRGSYFDLQINKTTAIYVAFHINKIYDRGEDSGYTEAQAYHWRLNMQSLIYVYDMHVTYYTDPLFFPADKTGLHTIKYLCDNEEFGLPFGKYRSTTIGGRPIYVPTTLVKLLPINIKNPQLKQEDKTYVKSNGEVVVLMAKYYKEWEAESDYISEDMHDAICTALSCDHVHIDGTLLTKSDSYEIAWDNTIKKACGQKLAKATWKMRANVAERNSNC